MKFIKIPDKYFTGKKKGYIKKFNHNIENINHRIYQARLKKQKYIRFVKGTGQSHLLDDNEFNNLISLLESQFKVSLEIFYQGNGEEVFSYEICWEWSMIKHKIRIIERTIKDGNNQIIKYTIKGCETEKVKVNSSGGYVFGDKSFSKGV